MRSVLDDRAQALLFDQRQQLAEVTTMAGLDTWRDNLVAAQRGGAFGSVLGIMVFQLADRDEYPHIQVAGYFAEWRRLLATTLRRMQTGGQLRAEADPDELATGLLAALRGGHVRAQASRNTDHMPSPSPSRLRSDVMLPTPDTNTIMDDLVPASAASAQDNVSETDSYPTELFSIDVAYRAVTSLAPG